MKNILTIIILAVATALAMADDTPLIRTQKDPSGDIIDKTKEIARDAKDAVVDTTKRIGTTARAMWIKSRGYMSEDPTVYRMGAEQKLTELGEEIAMVKVNAGMEQPAYFRTRVLALDQQHAYLTAQLPKLTPEEIKIRVAGGRFAFDQCVEALEEAIDQAEHEARRLTKIALK